ncbi:hypothetical protein LCGC14_2634550 [marine sediment metagenome]|uniref:Uncharacterized protein n=1 Tax=marine sediment metagenome TaxID=412755 RepID=A0A0F9CA76_9ZZZZ
MNGNYKNINVNFKKAHKDIYDWLRQYCNEKGYSLSHLIRELITELKRNEEAKNND